MSFYFYRNVIVYPTVNFFSSFYLPSAYIQFCSQTRILRQRANVALPERKKKGSLLPPPLSSSWIGMLILYIPPPAIFFSFFAKGCSCNSLGSGGGMYGGRGCPPTPPHGRFDVFAFSNASRTPSRLFARDNTSKWHLCRQQHRFSLQL